MSFVHLYLYHNYEFMIVEYIFNYKSDRKLVQKTDSIK